MEGLEQAQNSVSMESWRSDLLCSFGSDGKHSQCFRQHALSWQCGQRHLENVLLCVFCNCSFSPPPPGFYFFTVFLSVKTPEFPKLFLGWASQKYSWRTFPPFSNVLPTAACYGCLCGKVTVWSVSLIALWWVHSDIMILTMYHGKDSLSRKLGEKRRGRRRNREIKTNKQNNFWAVSQNSSFPEG